MRFTSLVDTPTPNGKFRVTPDTFEAIEALRTRVREFPGAELTVEPSQKSTGMENSGRSVQLTLTQNGKSALPLLWSLLVPLGFTPWNRYPVDGEYDKLYHFLGPWQMVYTHLTSSGWGAYAWDSTCLAARSDVGVWTDKPQMVTGRQTEVYVQSHLHRLGHNVGVIDGRIKEGDTRAIQSLGLVSTDLNAVASNISSIRPRSVGPKKEAFAGHVVVPGGLASIQAFGSVHATLTPQGAALKIEGPGRVVFDVEP